MDQQKTAWQSFAESLRIPTMVAFTMGCFAVLLFLWVSFGGNVPLKPKQYQIYVSFQDAATLAEQSDVRIAGVNVGKVRKKDLDKGGAATRATLTIDPRFAPLPADTRAILRQKSLLGETYVELTPGDAHGKKLQDGGLLPPGQVEQTTELDEILQIFDKPTKRAFRAWLKDQAMITGGGGAQNLNDALGNLSSFASDGADILGVLDNQKQALRLLVKNTGVVFGALNERQGELASLIRNSDKTFSATAQEKTALAETFAIFPTFLDESKATMARLETFSRNTQPLIEALQPVADDLTPTIRDVSNLAPDLESFFRNLPPVIRASTRDLPQAQRFLRGAIPVFAGLHQFLPELNPILSFANFDQTVLSGFVTSGSLATNYDLKSGNDAANDDGVNDYALEQFGVINNTSLQLNPTRPSYDRGNSYIAPNWFKRGTVLGIPESFDCKVTGGTKRTVEDMNPPCYVQPPSLYDNHLFTNLGRGDDQLVNSPGAESTKGTRPPTP